MNFLFPLPNVILIRHITRVLLITKPLCHARPQLSHRINPNMMNFFPLEKSVINRACPYAQPLALYNITARANYVRNGQIDFWSSGGPVFSICLLFRRTWRVLPCILFLPSVLNRSLMTWQGYAVKYYPLSVNLYSGRALRPLVPCILNVEGPTAMYVDPLTVFGHLW